MMHATTVYALSALVLLPALARAAEPMVPSGTGVGVDGPIWSGQIGGGVGVGPDYEGSDDFDVAALPVLRIAYRDRVFIDTREGIGVYAIRIPGVTVGGAIGYGAGREQDDNAALRGLGDIDPGLTGRMFASYTWGFAEFGASVQRDLSGNTDGTEATLSVGAGSPVFGQRVILRGGLGLTLADDNAMDAHFGITEQQASDSVYLPYDPEPGLKRIDLDLSATWRITEAVGVTAAVGLGTLLGDAADSPLVDQAGSAFQPSGGLFVAYRF